MTTRDFRVSGHVGERLSSQAAKALGVSPDPGKESLSAENDGDIKPWLDDSGDAGAGGDIKPRLDSSAALCAIEASDEWKGRGPEKGKGKEHPVGKVFVLMY